MTKVYVIGGATIDLFGIPFDPLKQQDSNPGILRYSFGGVARNIAENLARMDIPVIFVTALGNDVYGNELLKYCISSGIDMSRTVVFDDERTASYLAILNDQRDMHIAISDMTILKKINYSHLTSLFEEIKEDDILFIDTNFDEALIKWMLDHAPCPVFLDPISSVKARKLKRLSGIHTMKPNLKEAIALSGMSGHSDADMQTIGNFFIDQGMNQVYISLGKDGVFGCTKTQALHLRNESIVTVNTTGAGDALMAGLIHQYIRQSNLEDSLRYAIAASIVTTETSHSVHPYISEKLVAKRMNELQYWTTWYEGEE